MVSALDSAVSVEIIGSGVAGLCCARLFAERGCQVIVRAESNGVDQQCCSWWAGGMLAPWCELESTEHLIVTLGLESMEFWKRVSSVTVQQGSLVVATPRDHPDLQQFASRTESFTALDGQQIAELEPDLADRFERGLYFADEFHLDPRQVLAELVTWLTQRPNVSLQFTESVTPGELNTASTTDWRIDCRGLAARDHLPDLRGVKGEMVLIKQTEISLSRPVRLLHPRYPLYIVPRADNLYMVGATMIESDDRDHTTVRSLMELLSAAYAVHPIFAEASIVEIGVDARPAFPDNLPRLRRRGRTLYVNGLFRHGFLCGPAMARRAVELALDGIANADTVDENTN